MYQYFYHWRFPKTGKVNIHKILAYFFQILPKKDLLKSINQTLILVFKTLHTKKDFQLNAENHVNSTMRVPFH